MSETTITPRSNFSFNINANGSISTTSPTATIVNTSTTINPPQKRIRATGEVLNFLILEFEKNPSPSPDRRKFISQQAQMNGKAVRIWFQNRRAKQKKHERSLRQAQSSVSSASSSSSSSSSTTSSLSTAPTTVTDSSSFGKHLASHHTTFDFIQKHVPIEINDKYSFIDCTSLSVGSWQRIKSGIHKQLLLQNNLINLSPFNLNNVMQQVDLLVLLSRKNHELNYFFLAHANDSKILFRIFYPLSAISHCSLHDNLVQHSDNGGNDVCDSNELKIHLCHQPKFSVYFFNGLNSSTNQWSICDDFSEGQQVSRAYSSTVDKEYKFKDFETTTATGEEGEDDESEEQDEGNSDVPHVLVGSKIALNYLSSYISQSIVGLTNNNNNNATTNNTPHASTAAATTDITNSQFITSIPPESLASLKHHSFDLGITFNGQNPNSMCPNDLSSLTLNIDTNNSNRNDTSNNYAPNNLSVPSSATATATTTFNGLPFSTTSNQFYQADTPQSLQSFGNFNNANTNTNNNNKLDPLNLTHIKPTTSPEDVLSFSSDHHNHALFSGVGSNDVTNAYVHGSSHQINDFVVGVSDNIPYLNNNNNNNNDFDPIDLVGGNGDFQSSNIDFIDF